MVKIYGFGVHLNVSDGSELDGKLRVAIGIVSNQLDADHSPIDFDTSSGKDMVCEGDSGGPAFVTIGSESYLVGLDASMPPSIVGNCGAYGTLSNLAGFNRDQSNLAIHGNSSSLMNMVNQVLNPAHFRNSPVKANAPPNQYSNAPQNSPNTGPLF